MPSFLCLGAQIWSSDGSKMLFLVDTKASEGEMDVSMKGIASSLNFIFIGGSNGIISVISEKDHKFELVHEIRTSERCEITCLFATDQLLLAGNEKGDLFIYKITSSFEELCKFVGFGFMVTSVLLEESVAVAAYSSGHIRIFRLSLSRFGRRGMNELAIELCAHCRCINALALYSSKNIFASCGEDQMLNIWELSSFTGSEAISVKLIFNEKVDNRLLTGVTFFGDGRLAVVAYDDDKFLLFNPITSTTP